MDARLLARRQTRGRLAAAPRKSPATRSDPSQRLHTRKPAVEEPDTRRRSLLCLFLVASRERRHAAGGVAALQTRSTKRTAHSRHGRRAERRDAAGAEHALRANQQHARYLQRPQSRTVQTTPEAV